MAQPLAPPQWVVVYVDDEGKLQVYDSAYNKKDAAIALENFIRRYPDREGYVTTGREADRQRSR